MAKFNPDVKDEQLQQYGGNSRQITPVEDKTWEAIAKGADIFADTLPKAGYAYITGEIKKDAQARVDYIRATQGVDTYVEAFPGVPSSVPMTADQIRQQTGINAPLNIDPTRSDNPPISPQLGEPLQGTPKAAGLPGPDLNPFRFELARIHAARKAGKLSDTYYTTALEVAVRQMRARYPGFREEIDAAIRQETGITPANVLRNAIEADLAAAEKKQLTQAEQDVAFVRSHQKYLTPDEYRGKTIAEQKLIIQQRQHEEYGIDYERKRLDLAKDEEKAKQEKANTALIDTYNTKLSNMSAKVREMFTQIASRAKGGKPLAPDEIEIIRQQWGQLKAAYQQELDKIAEDTGPDGGKSFESLIADPTKVKQAKEQAMSKLTAMEQYLFDEKSGVFQHYANALSVGRDAVDYGMRSDRFVAVMSSIRRQFGPEAVNTLFNRVDLIGPNGQQIWANFQSTLVKQILGEGATVSDQGGSNKSISQTVTEILSKGVNKAAKPEVVSSVIQELIGEYNRIVNDPNSDPKFVEALTKFMNDQKNSDLLSSMKTPEDRAKLFEMMVNPQLGAAIKKRSDSAFEDYKKFATSSFSRLFSRDGNELTKIQKDDDFVYLDYNPATGQIIAVPTNHGAEYWANVSKFRGETPDQGLQRANAYIEGRYGNFIRSMNKNLKLMEPIAKEYGLNINQFLEGYVQTFLSPKKPTDNSFFAVISRKFLGGKAAVTEESLKPFKHVPLNPTGDPSRTRSILGSTKQVSEGEIDQIVRTVYGEAANEPGEGQKAVAAVILNRMKLTGGDAYDVTLAPSQFEPWNKTSTKLAMQRLNKESDHYKTIRKFVEAAIAGEDPTGGATHFYSPTGQAAASKIDNRALTPSWAVGMPFQAIGRHQFYKRQGDFKSKKTTEEE